MSVTQRQWLVWPLLILLLPLVIVAAVVWFLVAISLLLVVWTTWCPRGRYALVVYSESPIWHQYFDERVVPAIGQRGVVLNWSERKRWKFSLPVALFRMFAGSREFNPLVIVFRPFMWPRRFQFFRAFRAFKQGHPEAVEQTHAELLRLLDQLRG